MHADGMVGDAERGIGRAVEVVVVAGIVHQKVELPRIHLRVPGHEGQLCVGFTDQDNVAPAAALRLDERQQIGSDVGVGAEAEHHLAVLRAPRHQLRDHVGAARHAVACHMGVVRAQVVALRLG